MITSHLKKNDNKQQMIGSKEQNIHHNSLLNTKVYFPQIIRLEISKEFLIPYIGYEIFIKIYKAL